MTIDTLKALGDARPMDIRMKIFLRLSFPYSAADFTSCELYIHDVTATGNPDETITHMPSGSPTVDGKAVVSALIWGANMTPGSTYRVVAVGIQADGTSLTGYQDLNCRNVITADD